MTEAHGGHSMESQTPIYPGSFCASDDYVGRTIREKLREYRGMIISILQEKLTLQFIQALISIQLITPGEYDQLRKKQKRAQKASCLVDIISRKRGMDLKIFVDMMKIQCPKAHNMLHVPGCEQEVPSISSTWTTPSSESHAKYSTTTNTHIQTTASRNSHPARAAVHNLVHNIERGTRKAADKLEKCVTNSQCGVHIFLRELKSVLNSGVDIALVTFPNGHSIMHEVIRLNRLDYLEAIQYAGCWSQLHNLRIDSGPSGETPGELAKKLRRTKIVTALAEINEVEMALHNVSRCVRAGNVSLFRELKQMYHHYILRHVKAVSGQVSLLEYACQSGILPMLFEIIKTEQELGSPRVSIDKAAAICVNLGHYLLLQPLMEYVRVNINHIVVDGKTLMEHAAVNGDIESFHELEKLGAQPSDTIISLAAAQNRLPFLQEFLNNSKFSHLNFQDQRRKSALHFAAEKGNIEIVRILLEKGIDLMLKDKRGFTALHSAASGGSLATLEAILSSCEERHYNIQLLLTTRDRYLGSERCFLVRGRDNEKAAWHYVEANRGLIDVFRRRTQGGAVDVAAYGTVLKSGWGTAPPEEVVQEIEGLYDVINTTSDSPLDQQPLHVAVIKDQEAVSLKLISIMDDVEQPDRFGLTPIHLAAMKGNVTVIKALLEKGASQTVTDERGRTPLDIAEANDHPAAVIAVFSDDTETLRVKVFEAYQGLAKEKLAQCRQQGGDQKQQLKNLLRDLVADINDFLYDSLGEGPIAAESSS